MGNMLFQDSPKNSGNSVINMVNNLKAQGSSSALFNQMYQNNPNFKQFADQVRNMTPDQAFSQYGLDFNQFRNLRW